MNLDLEDLFLKRTDLTFLVGAGCSVDPPSCLPSGRGMMDAIIDYTCDESEIATVRSVEGLRFEALVEIIRDGLDEELRLIDYFGECDAPNLQHLFLAENIQRGNFVLTTNFDFLIERALLQSGVQKEEVTPVITREDFEKYQDPKRVFAQGKKAVYKIHGSTKNIVTGESTRDSLIATIQAFGANKAGENVFQIEHFKRPLFLNSTDGRSLVIMGYSGSDDFDIVPTLKVLKRLKNVYWINYVHDDKGTERLLEILADTDPTFDKHEKVNQILVAIKRMNHVEHLYRIDANTSRLLSSFVQGTHVVKDRGFTITPSEWLESTLTAPDEKWKFQIPHQIYVDLDMIDPALRCCEKLLEIAEATNDQTWKLTALNNIGVIYYEQGAYPEALQRFTKVLAISEQLGDLHEKANVLNNIGLVYNAQGAYPESLQRFKEVLEIAEQLGDPDGKAMVLNNIAEVYRIQGAYPEALERYQTALAIDEQLGDLRGKAARLNNIGLIYYEQGDYSEALQRYQAALETAKQLGDLRGKATVLNNSGEIYKVQGDYPKALQQFTEALAIAEQLGDLVGKATSLNNSGLIYYEQGDYSKALQRYQVALEIDVQLGDLRGKAIRLSNIGEVYKVQGNYPEALQRYQAALEIDAQLGDLRGKATRLSNIGLIYEAQVDYSSALKMLDAALRIDQELGTKPEIALRLKHIGRIYIKMNHQSTALEYFNRARVLYEELGLKSQAESVQSDIDRL